MAYQPASVRTNTGDLGHLIGTYYERKALDRLLPFYMFMEVTDPDVIPLRNGRTIQFFRYGSLGSNPNPSPEGVVGTPLPATTTTIQATVQQYSDFLVTSTLLEETAPDAIVTHLAELLGERAGASVNIIARTEIDTVSTVHETLGGAASSYDIRRMRTMLEVANVRPRIGNQYVGLIHPYIVYDIMGDVAPGGFVDVMRYANPAVFENGMVNNLNGEIGSIENVRFMKTNDVGTSGTVPNVMYRTYIFGKGAIGAVSLAGRGPSRVKDPRSQSFKVNIVKGGPSIADPEGNLGSAISYRFVFAVKRLGEAAPDDDRYRVFQADTTFV